MIISSFLFQYLLHVVQNPEQTNVLSIVLIDDHVFVNNPHAFDVVDRNYFL